MTKERQLLVGLAFTLGLGGTAGVITAGKALMEANEKAEKAGANTLVIPESSTPLATAIRELGVTFTPTNIPPTEVPATATSTETPPPPSPTIPKAPTLVPSTATKPPEQPPVVNLENLKRYGVYTSRLGDKGEILFYPLFQDQTLIAYMYKSQDGTKYFNARKGVVSKQPGTGQFQISYNEASRINLSAVVANDSSIGVLKTEHYPEGLNFSADPSGKEGSQALAQAWIDMAKRVYGAIYKTPDSALQEIETISGAKIPR
ncbi:hypothetical protein HYU94_03790 [Candidatus Daviesbacteria bacterium]|nr:hypothetical protein [Candidatus Daviesbacteria bacterium]